VVIEAPDQIDARDLRDPERFFREVVTPCKPVILKGFVDHWPAVAAGRTSPAALCDLIRPFDNGNPTEVFVGEAGIAGKYYYSDDLKGFNFERRSMTIGGALDAILGALDRPGAETIYLGSMPTDAYLPGFSRQNPIGVLGAEISPRLWIGHASNVSAHYDAMENIACVIAGKRRFTLYPPDAIADLYVGPIDNTMAGQPVSLAASLPPDPERFPRFEKVKDRRLVCDLLPGDALFLPKLWWHQVESTAPFNALVNYWWDAFRQGPDAPYTALLLAMITVAERPLPEREAWRAFFDHYVFRTAGHPLAHLPPESHGLLGPIKDNYGKIRARIMQILRNV
jgi:hypothetical protein